jgi:S1-C subfamily serine protease
MKNLIIVSITLVIILAITVMSLNTLEVISNERNIKLLPENYNPYQKLYDEMLYPTVRIESEDGVGSGVIINLECIDHVNAATTRSLHSIFILTAAHVVGNNTSVTVTIYSENVITSIPASVVITDTYKDLALLATDTHGITRTYSAKLAGKNYIPYLFTPVYTVGCSLGLDPRPSSGIITNITEERKNEGTEKPVLPFLSSSVSPSYWEVSAPILPGNSGGPVFSADTHEVIGIAVWVKVYHNQLITTMAGVVPIQTVYEFLDKCPRSNDSSMLERGSKSQ